MKDGNIFRFGSGVVFVGHTSCGFSCHTLASGLGKVYCLSSPGVPGRFGTPLKSCQGGGGGDGTQGATWGKRGEGRVHLGSFVLFL